LALGESALLRLAVICSQYEGWSEMKDNFREDNGHGVVRLHVIAITSSSGPTNFGRGTTTVTMKCNIYSELFRQNKQITIVQNKFVHGKKKFTFPVRFAQQSQSKKRQWGRMRRTLMLNLKDLIINETSQKKM
jgi:hypothetical protein